MNSKYQLGWTNTLNFKDFQLSFLINGRIGGKVISLEAPENSKDNFYIGGIKLNGKNWTRNYFKHSDLTNGAKIVYSMSAEPVTTRGTATEDKPYSFSIAKE